MKTTIFVFALIELFILLLDVSPAEARKHHKFKGVIIVNQILKLSGTITNNGTAAPEFSGVKEGDVLETGDKSSAVIRVPGLAIYRLGEKTKVRLTKFANRDHSKLQVFNGEVLILYKRLGDHEITTPQSSIVPEGAAAQTLGVRVRAADKPGDRSTDEISLWDGKIQIKSLNAPMPKTSVADATPVKSKVPQLMAEKISDAPKGMNVAVNPSSDSEPHAIELISQRSFKQVVASGDGLEEKKSGKDLPDLKLVDDLESLYGLP